MRNAIFETTYGPALFYGSARRHSRWISPPTITLIVMIFILLKTGPAAAENVIWNDLANVTATGNSLQKAAGCDGCQDAGAVSSQAITAGDGYVEITASETTTNRAFGLCNGNTDQTGMDIDFAILLTPVSSTQGGFIAEARENGIYKADTNYHTGDIFRVAIANNISTSLRWLGSMGQRFGVWPITVRGDWTIIGILPARPSAGMGAMSCSIATLGSVRQTHSITRMST